MYQRDTKVSVYPFTRQVEGEEIVIGRTDIASYLALPKEAVEILDHLAAGRSVGEAQDLFQSAYGEVPDMEDFLGLLDTHRFVAVEGHTLSLQEGMDPQADSSTSVRYHFDGISERFARAVFGPASLSFAGCVVALGLAALRLAPFLVPTRSALVFQHHSGLMLLVLAVLSYLGVFFHEMGHVIAARAVGVPSRLGVGHRLWIVVLEADLTALWSIPRRQRYVPFLAGAIVDAVSGSFLILLLLGEGHGLLRLAPTVHALVRAMTFVYFMALSWQFFFFVRTDLYYVIATHFGCKNLMQDTEAFLRNLIAPLFRGLRATDQSHIPLQEMKVVRSYAAIWLLGRMAAFGFLFLVTVPLLITYLGSVWKALGAGYADRPYPFLNALITGTLIIAPLGVGIFLWTRSLARAWRQTL